MKVFITKYALTEGIIEKDVVSISDTGMITCSTRPGALGEYYHGEGREWHKTHAAAVTKAEQMRQKKIASHQKAIAKLKNLTFQ